MGQSLDLNFRSLSFGPLSATTWSMLAEALARAGLHRSRGDEIVISYYQWQRENETVEIGAGVHHQAMGNNPRVGPASSYVTVFLPDKYFPQHGMIEASRKLLHDFLLLGEKIWGSLSPEEGLLAPEDTGDFLGRIVEPSEKDVMECARWSYAHFASPEIQHRFNVPACLDSMHPRPKTKAIANGGLLTVWDDSPEGVARFFSLF
jgi:hypothetical protein